LNKVAISSLKFLNDKTNKRKTIDSHLSFSSSNENLTID
jgi:hypothetical protein